MLLAREISKNLNWHNLKFELSTVTAQVKFLDFSRPEYLTIKNLTFLKLAPAQDQRDTYKPHIK